MLNNKSFTIAVVGAAVVGVAVSVIAVPPDVAVAAYDCDLAICAIPFNDPWNVGAVTPATNVAPLPYIVISVPPIVPVPPKTDRLVAAMFILADD